MFKEKEENGYKSERDQDGHFLNDRITVQAAFSLAPVALTKTVLHESGDAEKQCIFLINLVESRNLSTKPHPFDFIKCTIQVKLHFSIGSRQPQ